MQMQITFPGGSRVDAAFKGFQVQTDQPERSGGDGTAPAPFDYFLTSIGTCAGFYVLRFLEQRQLPVDDVSVVLSTTRDKEIGTITEILLSVNLPAEFPPKYKRAIVKAVNLCSVKKHIETPPVFRTEISIDEHHHDAKPVSA